MKAYGNNVIVIRDEIEKEKKGLLLPPGVREKPHQGTILSVGGTVQDEELRKAADTKCLFHRNVGQEIEYEGQIYLILQGHEVICAP